MELRSSGLAGQLTSPIPENVLKPLPLSLCLFIFPPDNSLWDSHLSWWSTYIPGSRMASTGKRHLEGKARLALPHSISVSGSHFPKSQLQIEWLCFQVFCDLIVGAVLLLTSLHLYSRVWYFGAITVISSKSAGFRSSRFREGRKMMIISIRMKELTFDKGCGWSHEQSLHLL